MRKIHIFPTPERVRLNEVLLEASRSCSLTEPRARKHPRVSRTTHVIKLIKAFSPSIFIRSDEYPPRLKDLAMWEYLHQHFQGSFDWFMHLDDDTYVEPGRLRAFLHGFSAAGRSNRPLYVGAPGKGRASDRQGHKLGLHLGR